MLLLQCNPRPEFFGTMNFMVYEHEPRIKLLDRVESEHLKVCTHIKPGEEPTYCSSISFERSKSTGSILCDDRVADALWENQDVLRELFAQMPDRESLCLCFEGTIFQCKDGFRYIRCIHFYKGYFTQSYIVLSSKNTDTDFVSVVLESQR